MSDLTEDIINATRQFSNEMGWQDDLESAENVLKIATDHAEDFAVRFENWQCENNVDRHLSYEPSEYVYWFNGERKSHAELLQIFKEKGL